MSQAVIETRDLGYKAGHHFILKNVDWTVNKGEHWVVFGLNGSGKTTLLSAIAGYNEYTNGELKVFGQQYADGNILDLRKKIGWVSSSFFDKCYSRESCLEVALSGLFATLGLGYGLKDRDVIKAKAILAELQLQHKVDHPYDLLSKGEQQRVLLARAIICNPEILILDEPGTGLDVFNREYMLNTIENLAKFTEMTIIYVTHYTEEILDIFDKCLLLQNGTVYTKDATKSIFNSEYLSGFLNYPVKTTWANGRINISLNVDSHLQELMS
jgi:ABC-type molybdenum transport system, ATPase component/photorepair protein PhrA